MNSSTSNPKISTTIANAATSEEETATKLSTTSKINSTKVLLGVRQIVQQTRSARQTLLTTTAAYTARNAFARMISYPAILSTSDIRDANIMDFRL